MRDPSLTEDYIFYRNLKKNYPLIVRGEGIYLYDDKDNEIIDGASGAAVVCLGHGEQRVIDAWARQAEKVGFVHMSTFSNEPILRLSEALATMSQKWNYHVYFTSGGSEAVETAIKVARQYHLDKGASGRHKVIARSISYHGATIGALSLTGHHYRRAKFSPILFSFPRISPPYCYRCAFHHPGPESCDLACAEDLERAILAEGSELVAAFIMEPVIGAAAPGVAPPVGYVKRIREICDRHDVLLIGDEVMTGVGRTGKFLATEHYQARPHIICLSKALSSGYSPLGAVMVENQIYDVLKGSAGHAFIHGHTFGGNPLSAAVGLEVLKILKEENLVEHVAEMGEYWLGQLQELKNKYRIVGDVRGKGLLLGIEFVRNSEQGKAPFDPSLKVRNKVQEKCLKKGLYVYPGGYSVGGMSGDHILLAPPYIVQKEDIDRMTQIIGDALREINKMYGL
jgi:adenosylmethionine-8-amino-7-oxononanoate aminotransferase